MAKTIDEQSEAAAAEIKAVAMNDLARADGGHPRILAVVRAALLAVARDQQERDEKIARSVSDKAGLDALRVRSAGMVDEFEIYQHHRRNAADDIAAAIRNQRIEGETSNEG